MAAGCKVQVGSESVPCSDGRTNRTMAGVEVEWPSLMMVERVMWGDCWHDHSARVGSMRWWGLPQGWPRLAKVVGMI